MLDAIEKSRDELLDMIKRELAAAYQNVPEDKVKVQAEQYLWFTTVILSFTVLRLVANAIAAPELEPIYDEALKPQDTPALRLLSLSLQMYLSSDFPDRSLKRFLRDYKKKSIPFTVLKLLAMEHFELISVPIPMRKSICALLGIQYKVLALPPGK